MDTKKTSKSTTKAQTGSSHANGTTTKRTAAATATKSGGTKSTSPSKK